MRQNLYSLNYMLSLDTNFMLIGARYLRTLEEVCGDVTSTLQSLSMGVSLLTTHCDELACVS